MAPTTDPRFARLQTDPRFRRPKQKNLKVEIDERFRDVLEGEEFGGAGKGKGKAKDGRVDKRGRAVTSSHHADQLKRFYRLRSPSPTASSSRDVGFVDYARGEGVLSSSGDEDEEESEVDEEELELGEVKKRLPTLNSDEDESESVSESGESHLNIDLSEDEAPLLPLAIDVPEEEAEAATPTLRIAAVNLDWDNLRATDLFSAFNSFLKADKVMKRKLLNVRIYPSEFGKDRMEREEAEGPGGGIFAGKANMGKGKKDRRKEGLVRQEDLEEEDDSEMEDGTGTEDEEDEGLSEDADDDDVLMDEDEDEDELDADDDDVLPLINGKQAKEIDGLEIISDVSSEAGEDDIDMDQLRQYQLERLRYYYAIGTFSTVAAAQHVMDECNGTEFERTANMMDLSYVPQRMEFDEEVRDEATSEERGYKGNDFVTDALRHSKVKLTWDQDDPNRTKVTRRALTRDEIEEQDFKAYVASSGSDDEDEVPPNSGLVSNGTNGTVRKEAKKQSPKDRTKQLRALLLERGDEDYDVWGKTGSSRQDDQRKGGKAGDGDMEITFRPGLDISKPVDEAEEDNLTTLEKYQMRMKERKARKKEKIELKRATKDDDGDEPAKPTMGKDDFFGDGSGSEEEPTRPVGPKAKAAAPASKAKAKVAEVERMLPAAKMISEDLGGDVVGVEHFSIKDIMKAEKGEGKKRKRKRPGKGLHADEREIELGPTDWKIDVRDQRFKALHEEPEFAIDPSDPHFTKTKAMKEMLAERARLRAKEGSKQPMENRKAVGQPQRNGGDKDLSSLVQSIKRKMDRNQNRGRKRSKK